MSPSLNSSRAPRSRQAQNLPGFHLTTEEPKIRKRRVQVGIMLRHHLRPALGRSIDLPTAELERVDRLKQLKLGRLAGLVVDLRRDESEERLRCLIHVLAQLKHSLAEHRDLPAAPDLRKGREEL